MELAPSSETSGAFTATGVDLLTAGLGLHASTKTLTLALDAAFSDPDLHIVLRVFSTEREVYLSRSRGAIVSEESERDSGPSSTS